MDPYLLFMSHVCLCCVVLSVPCSLVILSCVYCFCVVVNFTYGVVLDCIDF